MSGPRSGSFTPGPLCQTVSAHHFLLFIDTLSGGGQDQWFLKEGERGDSHTQT